MPCAEYIEPYGGPTIPVNQLIDGVTITRFESTELKLFNTAALACSRSGKRRMDFVTVAFSSGIGLLLHDRGLRATDQ
jgi:hypothetical protein